jgi:hypothetical protein
MGFRLKKEDLIYKDWTILNSLGLILLGSGFLLILEHYFKWGVLDLTDFPFGHEYTALFMLIIGFLLLSKQANQKFKSLFKGGKGGNANNSTSRSANKG